jgi:hypothetical protein
MQCVAHFCVVFNMNFQEHWSWETAKNLTCSPSKVAFIMDGLHTKLRRLYRMRGEWVVWGFRKISAMEREIKRYFALQVRCHSLLTDCKHSYIVSSVCVDPARFEISGRSREQKQKCRRKSTLFSTCPSSLTDHYQSYVFFVKCVESEKYEISRNSLHWKHRWRWRVLCCPMMYHCMTNCKETYTVFRVWVGSARYESSGKLHEWIPRQGRKGTLFSG